jgi:hypothetical protein
MHIGTVAPSGTLKMKVNRAWPSAPTLAQVVKHGLPRPGLDRGVAMWRLRNLPNLWRGLWRTRLALVASKITHAPAMFGVLYLDKIGPDGSRTSLGLASLRVVTDTGVAFIVDAFQNTTELENLKFHGFGTGTTAEAASQTALVTELTTQYNPDSTRPTGSTTEGATANIYRTVATLTPDAGGTIAVTEHAVLSQAATGGGTMLDRSVFSAVNVVASADSLQATYDLTFTSGS